VTIEYKDFDNQVYSTEYRIFAKDKVDACKIAKELFFVNYGKFNDMRFVSKAIIPTEEERSFVEQKFSEVIGVVKKTFTDLNYQSFLKAFENFSGKDLTLDVNYASFWISFLGVECKAVWQQGYSYVDLKRFYFTLNDGKSYVIQNKLSDEGKPFEYQNNPHDIFIAY
jgi:hypothetical protein